MRNLWLYFTLPSGFCSNGNVIFCLLLLLMRIRPLQEGASHATVIASVEGFRWSENSSNFQLKQDDEHHSLVLADDSSGCTIPLGAKEAVVQPCFAR